MDEICFPDEKTPIIGKREYHWWIVYSDGKPVAYAGAKKYLCYLDLIRVGVLPEYRGNGIQKMLIASRVEFAREQEVHEVITYTSRCNLHSIDNLRESGFVIWAPTDKKIYFGDEFLYWRII